MSRISLLCVFCFVVTFCSGDKWDSDYLESDIYYWASGESKCVRLSTIYNRTGCATYSDGEEAQLRYLSNTTDLDALISSIKHKKQNSAIVMNLELISSEIIMNLTTKLHDYCKGIIFIQSNDKLTIPSNRNGYSPDSTSPMYYLRPKSQGDAIYHWNSKGSYLMFEEFPFAIITIKKSQSSHIESLAETNENLIGEGSFGSNFVEFNYPMYAHNTTMDCIPDDDCLPVGGYSVWSTFQVLNTTSTLSNTSAYSAYSAYSADSTQSEPDSTSSNTNGDESNQSSQSSESNQAKINQRIIMATTSMDTTALFHQNICRGSDANQAGLIAFLAAMTALSGIKSTMQTLEKQVIFAAFQGESYDLVGSRKFVHDISGYFTCQDPMSSSDSNTFTEGCWQPYSTSLDFLKLDVNLIDSVIELNQIGIKKTSTRELFAHYERKNSSTSDPMNSNISDIIDTMQTFAKDISNQTQIGFEVKAADSVETPGTPPSSYWSFLRQVPNLTGVVLTDHYTSYSNEWYHSVYDSYYNSLDVEQICMTATLFGRMLYKLAANEETQYSEDFMKKNINADCLLVEELMECLMVDMSCDLVSTMASQASDSTPTHYTSVYRIIEDQDITGTSKFVFRYMANLTRRGSTGSSCSSNKNCMPSQVCGGTSDGTYCVDSSTYFHAAVDTNLVFDYSSELWKVPSYEYGNVTSMVWTESMWSSRIGTRFYEKESDETKLAMLLLGIAMFMVAFCGNWWLSKHCREKFTVLQM